MGWDEMGGEVVKEARVERRPTVLVGHIKQYRLGCLAG